MLDRRSNQRLAVRARDEGARSHLKIDRPKSAVASDVGDRLSAPAALNMIEEAAWSLAAWIVEDQPIPSDAERRCHQQFGIKPRRVAGTTQRLCGATQCSRNAGQ